MARVDTELHGVTNGTLQEMVVVSHWCSRLLLLVLVLTPTAFLSTHFPWFAASADRAPMSITKAFMINPWTRRLGCAGMHLMAICFGFVATWRHVAVLARVQHMRMGEAMRACLSSWISLAVALLFACALIFTGAFDPGFDQFTNCCSLLLTSVSGAAYCTLQSRIDALANRLLPKQKHWSDKLRNAVCGVLVFSVLFMVSALFLSRRFDTPAFALCEWTTSVSFVLYLTSWFFAPPRTYAIDILVAVQREEYLCSTSHGFVGKCARPDTIGLNRNDCEDQIGTDGHEGADAVGRSATSNINETCHGNTLFVIPARAARVLVTCFCVEPLLFLGVCYPLSFARGRLRDDDYMLSSAIDVGFAHHIGSVGMTTWGWLGLLHCLWAHVNLFCYAAQCLPRDLESRVYCYGKMGCLMVLLSSGGMVLSGSFETAYNRLVHTTSSSIAFLFGLCYMNYNVFMHRLIFSRVESTQRCWRRLRLATCMSSIMGLGCMGYALYSRQYGRLGAAELTCVAILSLSWSFHLLPKQWTHDDFCWVDVLVAATRTEDESQHPGAVEVEVANGNAQERDIFL